MTMVIIGRSPDDKLVERFVDGLHSTVMPISATVQDLSGYSYMRAV